MQRLIRWRRSDSSGGSLDRFADKQFFHSMKGVGVVGCRGKASLEGWGPKDLGRGQIDEVRTEAFTCKSESVKYQMFGDSTVLPIL
jgi:hypothetical protein